MVKQSIVNIVTILYAAFPLIFLSCSENRIKDEDKFARLYVDLLIQQEKAGTDTAKLSTEKNRIYKKYNVTSNQVEATTKYYNKNSDMWKTFFEKADLYLAQLRKNDTTISPRKPLKATPQTRRNL